MKLLKRKRLGIGKLCFVRSIGQWQHWLVHSCLCKGFTLMRFACLECPIGERNGYGLSVISWRHTQVLIKEVFRVSVNRGSPLALWRCKRNIFNRPVLKHGPRSVAFLQELKLLETFLKKTRNESNFSGKKSFQTLAPLTDFEKIIAIFWLIWVIVKPLWPERRWTMSEQGEARGNSGGGSKGY